jgi:hypothetical protein
LYVDRLHLRSFDFTEFEESNRSAINSPDTGLFLDLCKPIPKSTIKEHCILSDAQEQENLEDVYMVHRFLEHSGKVCYLFKKSEIALYDYDIKTQDLKIFVSDIHKKRPDSTTKILAYKFEIKTLNQTKTEIYYKNRKSEKEYDRIVYTTPGKTEKIKPFMVTSINVSLFALISLPRVLFLFLMVISLFLLHLGMHKVQHPLQHVMFCLNWLYLFFTLVALLGLQSLWLNTIALIAFLAIGVVIMQFTPYKRRVKLGLWMNLLIFFEIFSELVDLFDNFTELLFTVAGGLLFLLLAGKCVVWLRDNEKIPMMVTFNDEIAVTAIYTLKIGMYIFRRKEPIRIPVFALGLLKVKSNWVYKEENVVDVYFYTGGMIVLVVLRMIFVVWKRSAKEGREEDYGKSQTQAIDERDFGNTMLFEKHNFGNIDIAQRSETSNEHDSSLIKL